MSSAVNTLLTGCALSILNCNLPFLVNKPPRQLLYISSIKSRALVWLSKTILKVKRLLYLTMPSLPVYGISSSQKSADSIKLCMSNKSAIISSLIVPSLFNARPKPLYDVKKSNITHAGFSLYCVV